MRPLLLLVILLHVLSLQTGRGILPRESERVGIRHPALPKSTSGKAVLIDSSLTFDEAMQGANCPDEVRRTLTIVDIEHFGYDGKIHRGQLILRRDLAKEAKAIFRKLLQARFPIEKILPIVRYHWSDEAAMQDNNTSGFNYRFIPGTTKISRHAFGRAIDINPRTNPYIAQGVIHPPGARYIPASRGAITAKGTVVRLFKQYGWRWGGDWKEKDWQHFDK